MDDAEGGGGGFDRDGGGRRGRTFRLHEQLEPERMQKMPYGSKGTRRIRPGFPPSMAGAAGQGRREFGGKQVSGAQAFRLLGKYIAGMAVAVGLFFVVAFFVNDLVKQMKIRSFAG